LETDNLKFHLDDLEAHGDTTSAILSVLDANDNILKKDKIAPGETKEFNIQGKTYRVHVYKVAPGYTFGAKWADMAIYAKELKLESGKYLDEDQETNPNWKVALGWKNKDGASDDAGTPGNEAAPDHLRSIILWSDKLDGLTVGGEDEKMGPGAYIPFVEDPVVWKLTYSGLDITNADRDTLKFELSKTGEKRFSESLMDSTTSAYLNCKVIAPYIEVSSSKTGTPLRVSQDYGYKEVDISGANAVVSDPTDMNYNELYIALNDLQCGADWSSLKSLYGGIFMRLSSSGAEHYGFAPFDDDTTMDNEFARTLEIEYEDIGDGDTTFFNGGGVIEVKPINAATGAISDDVSDGAVGIIGPNTFEEYLEPDVDLDSLANTNFLFVMAEKAGEGTSDDSTDYWVFGVDNTPTFKYDDNVGTNTVMTDNGDEIFYTYAGPVNSIGTFDIKEDGFVSETQTRSLTTQVINCLMWPGLKKFFTESLATCSRL